MDRLLLKKLVDAMTAISEAGNERELRTALEAGIVSFGFSSFRFSCNVADWHDMVLAPMMTNWPRDFREQYQKHKWIERDPLLNRARLTRSSFAWSVPELLASDIDPAQKQYVHVLDEMEMRSGVVIVSSANGLFDALSVEAKEICEISQAPMEALRVTTHAASVKAEFLKIPKVSTPAARILNVQQIDILKWIAEGKSNTDIAAIMGQTRRAVDYHVSEILRKLGVATRLQAAAMFLEA